MTGAWLKSRMIDLIVVNSQGESRRSKRRADENACRGWTEGGGEHFYSLFCLWTIVFTISLILRFCWSSPTSRICQMQWTRLRSRISLAFTAWETETGTFRWNEYSLWPKIWYLIKKEDGSLNFFFQATCATSGDGLYEGLDWLSNQLKNAARWTFFFTKTKSGYWSHLYIQQGAPPLSTRNQLGTSSFRLFPDLPWTAIIKCWDAF